MKTKRFFSTLFPTRRSQTRKLPTHARNLLRFESLEERTLLSISPFQYDAIQSKYSDFNLPESMEDINIIEITNQDLTAEKLQKEIYNAAYDTSGPDLIVLRTTSDRNTITYATWSDKINISIDSTKYGSLTIVSLGFDNDGKSIPLTIDAAQQSHVMSIYTTATVNLGGLTLTGGTIDSSGGAIHNQGTLTVMNSTIEGNSASTGGGIYNLGTLTVINSTIAGNSASFGGGIYNSNGGTMTVKNSTIAGNSAEFNGGGIYDSGNGILIVTKWVIAGNSA
ncbi:MAG: right-handed parallel beta-helix repeat-containing protein [Planctomycetia bacterium]|nr:right-handed parallel beta-helix repeat-containing protein [Planctomycetia bacterium]